MATQLLKTSSADNSGQAHPILLYIIDEEAKTSEIGRKLGPGHGPLVWSIKWAGAVLHGSFTPRRNRSYVEALDSGDPSGLRECLDKVEASTTHTLATADF